MLLPPPIWFSVIIVVLLERRDATASCEPFMAAASPLRTHDGSPVVSSCAYVSRAHESNEANTLNVDRFDHHTTLDLAGSNDVDRTRPQHRARTLRARPRTIRGSTSNERSREPPSRAVPGQGTESRRQRSCRIHASSEGDTAAARHAPPSHREPPPATTALAGVVICCHNAQLRRVWKAATRQSPAEHRVVNIAMTGRPRVA